MKIEPYSRLTDSILILYLLITAGLILAGLSQISNGGILFCCHLIAALLLFLLRYLPENVPEGIRFARSWYPVVLFPVFFKEVEILAAAVGDWRLTEILQNLEVQIFGGHPSLYWSQMFPSVFLSEFLHFTYIAYVVLVPVVGGYWYFKGQKTRFSELILLVTAVYSLSYLFFILFPVDSPFYLFEPLDSSLHGYPFYELVHFVSGNGGARGGAFPSSHVSVSMIIFMVVWSYQKKLALLISPVIVGIVFATVYGRFHYLLDVFAGLALAIAVFTIWKSLSPYIQAKGDTLKE